MELQGDDRAQYERLLEKYGTVSCTGSQVDGEESRQFSS